MTYYYSWRLLATGALGICLTARALKRIPFAFIIVAVSGTGLFWLFSQIKQGCVHRRGGRSDSGLVDRAAHHRSPRDSESAERVECPDSLRSISD